MNIKCWWFGCLPDRDNEIYRESDFTIIPCLRCGADDIVYADLVGDTRWENIKDLITYWFYRKWVPPVCPDCGTRYGNHDRCLPF